jgi:Ran GTPase-activating protein (RanGAP) involved in mRNA processing and transport
MDDDGFDIERASLQEMSLSISSMRFGTFPVTVTSQNTRIGDVKTAIADARGIPYGTLELFVAGNEEPLVDGDTVDAEATLFLLQRQCNDRQALEVFFRTTNGVSWELSEGWLVEEDLGKWDGVHRDAGGCVDGIALTGKTFVAVPADEQAAALSGLEEETGSILPPGLAALTFCAHLRELSLAKCIVQLLGQGIVVLAAFIKRAPLSKLDLSWNRMGVPAARTLAEAFRGNTTLRSVNLAHNSFCGKHACRRRDAQGYLLSEPTPETPELEPEGMCLLGAALLQYSKVTELTVAGIRGLSLATGNDLGIQNAFVSAVAHGAVLTSCTVNAISLPIAELKTGSEIRLSQIDRKTDSASNGGIRQPLEIMLIGTLAARNHALAQLDLSGNGIERVGMASITSVVDLGTWAYLSNVNVLGNNTSTEQAHALMRIRRTKKALRTLCGISDGVATALDFSGRGLGPRCAMLLADELPEMASLSSLDVSGNRLGAQGVRLIVELGIPDLDISNNEMRSGGARALASILQAKCQNTAGLNMATEFKLTFGGGMPVQWGMFGACAPVGPADRARGQPSESKSPASRGAEQARSVNRINFSYFAAPVRHKNFAELKQRSLGAPGLTILSSLLAYCHIKVLDVSQTQIGGLPDKSGMHALSNAMHGGAAMVEELSVACNNLDAKDCDILAGAIAGCATVSNVDISGNDIGQGARHFIRAFSERQVHCVTLGRARRDAVIDIGMTEADFSKSNLSVQNSQIAAVVIERCTSLCSILVTGDNAAGTGTNRKSLRLDATDTCLSVSNCLMRSPGAITLAAFIPKCLELQALDVSKNFLGERDTFEAADLCWQSHPFVHPKGLLAITDALQHCERLRSLNLSSNSLQAPQAVVIARVLTRCQQLTELVAANNSFGSEGIAVLGRALGRSATCLKRLDLSACLLVQASAPEHWKWREEYGQYYDVKTKTVHSPAALVDFSGVEVRTTRVTCSHPIPTITKLIASRAHYATHNLQHATGTVRGYQPLSFARGACRPREPARAASGSLPRAHTRSGRACVFSGRQALLRGARRHGDVRARGRCSGHPVRRYHCLVCFSGHCEVPPGAFGVGSLGQFSRPSRGAVRGGCSRGVRGAEKPAGCRQLARRIGMGA